MIDQVIWLIANISATSHSLKKKMLSSSYIIEQMNRLITQNSKIKKGHLKTILWCCSNLAQPSMDDVEEHLTEDELLQLVMIFVAAIEIDTSESSDNSDVDSILELGLFGLIRIMKIPSERIVEFISKRDALMN